MNIEESLKRGFQGFTLKNFGTKYIVHYIDANKIAHCYRLDKYTPCRFPAHKNTVQQFLIEPNDYRAEFITTIYKVNPLIAPTLKRVRA